MDQRNTVNIKSSVDGLKSEVGGGESEKRTTMRKQMNIVESSYLVSELRLNLKWIQFQFQCLFCPFSPSV